MEKTYRDCPVFRTLESEEVINTQSIPGTDKISDYLGFNVPVIQTRKKILLPADLPEFCCLAIIGRSGGGKTTMLRDLAERGLYHFPRNKFDNAKAIVSNFSSKEDAIERLSAVGLKSIPTWVKPRNVLSVGEGFRADMALNIEDYVMLDEFTSTVDRNVARSCCASLGR